MRELLYYNFAARSFHT